MKKFLCLIMSLALIFFSSILILRHTLDEELEIYDQTLRLHIPANSNSESDQSVKLKVRDAVIDYLEEPLANCKTKDEAVTKVQFLSNEITRVANNVLKENNKDYTARVSVVNEYYPEKDYGELSLPAGNYASLKIELGAAQGQNWWCVLFPQVCTGTAKPTEALAEVGFTPNQIKLLTKQEESEYVVKFKLLEIIESIFG